MEEPKVNNINIVKDGIDTYTKCTQNKLHRYNFETFCMCALATLCIIVVRTHRMPYVESMEECEYE